VDNKDPKEPKAAPAVEAAVASDRGDSAPAPAVEESPSRGFKGFHAARRDSMGVGEIDMPEIKVAEQADQEYHWTKFHQGWGLAVGEKIRVRSPMPAGAKQWSVSLMSTDGDYLLHFVSKLDHVVRIAKKKGQDLKEVPEELDGGWPFQEDDIAAVTFKNNADTFETWVEDRLAFTFAKRILKDVTSVRVHGLQEHEIEKTTKTPAPGAPKRALPTLEVGGVLRSAVSGKEYAMVKHLGKGAFGSVWLCDAQGEQRAVKVVPMDGAADVAKEVELSRKGAKLGGVGYGRVPLFYEAAEGVLVGKESEPLLLIVTEYIDGVTLGTALRGSPRHRKLPEEIVKIIAVDLLRTLARLHEDGMVHRDVKPDNIILSRKGYSYLCDFGVSQFLPRDPGHEGSTGTIVGTPLYMAPEVVDGRGGCKVDVWSAGMTFYQLLHGSHPLEDLLGEAAHPERIFDHLAKEHAPSVGRLKTTSSDMKRIVHACLQRDPAQRAQAKDLLMRRGMGPKAAERQ